VNFCHVYPVNDLKPHISELCCECDPWSDPDDISVIIHPAYNEAIELREYYKRA